MMALNGDQRAQAIYNTIDVSSLDASEKTALLDGLKTVYGADTSYLTANAQIEPGTMLVASGIPVATVGTATAQTGATTAPEPVSGSGLLT